MDLIKWSLLLLTCREIWVCVKCISLMHTNVWKVRKSLYFCVMSIASTQYIKMIQDIGGLKLLLYFITNSKVISAKHEQWTGAKAAALAVHIQVYIYIYIYIYICIHHILLDSIHFLITTTIIAWNLLPDLKGSPYVAIVPNLWLG
jgi:hypothetical protein